MKTTRLMVFGFCILIGASLYAQADRIKRVEDGLLPEVLIKGDPAWALQERMANDKVPAVSIAVIENFKIVWAKAHGAKDE